MEMNKGARAVASAIVGADFRTVVVAGKAYTVTPPTIRRLAGAIAHLSAIREAETARDVLLTLGDAGKYAKALSWFISGDETLAPELEGGTLDELADALEACVSMVSVKVFLKAVSLARSVGLLAAKPR